METTEWELFLCTSCGQETQHEKDPSYVDVQCWVCTECGDVLVW